MAKLCKEKREELVDFIRNEVNKHLELKNIQGKIFVEFGVYFSLRSICYYIDKAEQDKRIAKYEQENELMRKWWCDDKKEELNVADLLYSVMTKKDSGLNDKLLSVLK